MKETRFERGTVPRINEYLRNNQYSPSMWTTLFSGLGVDALYRDYQSNFGLDASNSKVDVFARPQTPPSQQQKIALPISCNESHFGTPIKFTSSSMQGSEQIHRLLDERILQEIDGCVFRDTQGFYRKYFEGKPWSPNLEVIIKATNPKINDGRWADFPEVPSQQVFFNWFFDLDFLQGQRSAYYTSHGMPLSGSDCKRKPDLFVALEGTEKCNVKYNWADVLVIGELKQSELPQEYRKEFVAFCGHAREVFASQPTRRFIHGFIIRGCIMELWVLTGPDHTVLINSISARTQIVSSKS
ncbi:hypothetical protein RUND412_007231 [Rhizina undulata]